MKAKFTWLTDSYTEKVNGIFNHIFDHAINLIQCQDNVENLDTELAGGEII